MKNKKILVTIISTLLIASSLSACGNPNNNSQGDNKDNDDTLTSSLSDDAMPDRPSSDNNSDTDENTVNINHM